ncbi:uncharacterized protein BDR25DRAFT_359530 [Lindgomyces ingoldianus]|uniref:Uncharacterized protein n=1 Tax=Lindgomyces ingoldianus TaxID=673940 RepID=A0ACB6QIC3_9PLEO|nr:uncharacterized protein BDR25DRAFT_359530 [Lindgomyces ingoldianus]KAF2466631.1 hypothetical protein BDR25DRAFT_359530 [Lindgomyces ingoldianus]
MSVDLLNLNFFRLQHRTHGEFLPNVPNRPGALVLCTPPSIQSFLKVLPASIHINKNVKSTTQLSHPKPKTTQSQFAAQRRPPASTVRSTGLRRILGDPSGGNDDGRVDQKRDISEVFPHEGSGRGGMVQEVMVLYERFRFLYHNSLSCGLCQRPLPIFNITTPLDRHVNKQSKFRIVPLCRGAFDSFLWRFFVPSFAITRKTQNKPTSILSIYYRRFLLYARLARISLSLSAVKAKYKISQGISEMARRKISDEAHYYRKGLQGWPHSPCRRLPQLMPFASITFTSSKQAQRIKNQSLSFIEVCFAAQPMQQSWPSRMTQWTFTNATQTFLIGVVDRLDTATGLRWLATPHPILCGLGNPAALLELIVTPSLYLCLLRALFCTISKSRVETEGVWPLTGRSIHIAPAREPSATIPYLNEFTHPCEHVKYTKQCFSSRMIVNFGVRSTEPGRREAARGEAVVRRELMRGSKLSHVSHAILYPYLNTLLTRLPYDPFSAHSLTGYSPVSALLSVYSQILSCFFLFTKMTTGVDSKIFVTRTVLHFLSKSWNTPIFNTSNTMEFTEAAEYQQFALTHFLRDTILHNYVKIILIYISLFSFPNSSIIIVRIPKDFIKTSASPIILSGFGPPYRLSTPYPSTTTPICATTSTKISTASMKESLPGGVQMIRDMLEDLTIRDILLVRGGIHVSGRICCKSFETYWTQVIGNCGTAGHYPFKILPHDQKPTRTRIRTTKNILQNLQNVGNFETLVICRSGYGHTIKVPACDSRNNNYYKVSHELRRGHRVGESTRRPSYPRALQPGQYLFCEGSWIQWDGKGEGNYGPEGFDGEGVNCPGYAAPLREDEMTYP